MKKQVLGLVLAITSFGIAAGELQQEGNWYFKTQANKMTDATDIVATNSTKDIYIKQGLERNTSLVLRCKENKTDAYLSVSDYLGNDSPTVTVRFDDAKPVKQRWSSAEGGDAAFAPNAPAFIKELTKHKKLIAGFEPYGSTMQIVEFDLTGIDKIASQVADACKWKL